MSLAKESSWNNVRILDPGTNIVVKTRLGEKYEGKLKGATADSISVVVVSGATSQIITLRKDEVKEVRKKRMPRLVSTLLGAGVGMGAGLGTGAIADAKWNPPGTDDPGLFKGIFGTLGLYIGTGIGLGVSFRNNRVYEAP
jgi:hypothetical protein